ncbi:MAG: endonuclease MutS2 [Planctomycetes bacterium]|nr:endonuclease MutS2 [Planctomycetota bacterium]
MNDHTLRVLEFSKVLDKLAGSCASEAGAAAARALAPLFDPWAIRRRHALTSELMLFLAADECLPLDGLRDLAPHLKLARVDGATLEGKSLFAVAVSLRAARLLRDQVRRLERQELATPLLREYVGRFRLLPTLEKNLITSLDSEGGVLDEASSGLHALRQRRRSLEWGIQEKLERMVRSSSLGEALQDQFITRRDGRWVLPVKSTHRGQIAGIVHDRSDSGSTVFVEPEGVVELGNAHRDLETEERVEVNRILREFTVAVGRAADEIEADHALLVELDVLTAQARLARDYQLTVPGIGDGAFVDWRAARHPTLVFAGRAAVPIDLRVGEEFRTLVITGPNTGGKTVTLKTAGLLALMAQAGMPVPAAEGSRCGVFRAIHCDVGDEQSIEQSLSTFSSHLSRIVAILADSDAGTLVLLDELGAGTDPAEGGALGQAILETLHERGARTVVTTHLSDLKILAHGRPGMANGSVQFDPATLRPTYQLVLGIPGNSNALVIAERLGITPDILARARGYLGQGRLDLEALIGDLHAKRAELEAERATVARARAEASALERQIQEQLAAWKSKKQTIVLETRAEAAAFLEEARREVHAVVEELRARPREQKEYAAAAAGKAAERLAGVHEKVGRYGAGGPGAGGAAGDGTGTAAPAPQPLELTPGRRVRVKSLNCEGEVLEVLVKKGRVRVGSGDFRVEVALADVEPAPEGKAARAEDRLRGGGAGELGRSPGKGKEAPGAKLVRAHPGARVEGRLHLLGKRVEAALRELEHYLNAAALQGLVEVQVVHGYGTGAMEKAVVELLKRHPLVTKFRTGESGEGGGGVTVVTLEGGGGGGGGRGALGRGGRGGL